MSNQKAVCGSTYGGYVCKQSLGHSGSHRGELPNAPSMVWDSPLLNAEICVECQLTTVPKPTGFVVVRDNKSVAVLPLDKVEYALNRYKKLEKEWNSFHKVATLTDNQGQPRPRGLFAIPIFNTETIWTDYPELAFNFQERLHCSRENAALMVVIAQSVCHVCWSEPSGCQCWNDE